MPHDSLPATRRSRPRGRLRLGHWLGNRGTIAPEQVRESSFRRERLLGADDANDGEKV